MNKILVLILSLSAFSAEAAKKNQLIVKLCQSASKDLFWTYQLGDEDAYEISMVGGGTENAILPFRGYEGERLIYSNNKTTVSLSLSSRSAIINDGKLIKISCESRGE